MSQSTAPVIQIEGLRKVYRSRRKARMALDGLDLVVEPGQVHGFLGPNGSGKTTTLRALLGLVRADAGTMRIFDHEVPDSLPYVLGAVGAVVESPQFFGNFTARRTLRLLATVGGIKRKRVDEVLETVGLRDRAKERVRSYSLGMKQRLAVATALLKSPKLLILDEPANGLDPAGIREMRDLLRSLGASGMTVLLSSHILSEVQQICDTVSIISMGRRVVSGPVSEVLSQFDKGDVRVKVADLEAAAKLVGDAGLPVQVYGDHMVVSDLADPAWITETLAKRRMYVSELTPLVPDLENVFLNLTGTVPTPGVRRQVDDAYRPPLTESLHIMEPATIELDEPALPEVAAAEVVTELEPVTEPGAGSGPASESAAGSGPAVEPVAEPVVELEPGGSVVEVAEPAPAEVTAFDPVPGEAGSGGAEPVPAVSGGATTAESDGALTTPDVPTSPAPAGTAGPTSPTATAATAGDDQEVPR